MMNFKKYLQKRKALINRAILKYLPPETAFPGELARAMRYSLLVGGKRLRPILVLAACEAAGGKTAAALPTAVAIELIHTYSLIHDDLPAMDNDDFRRGRPTSHKIFGEALAILAGDALMTLAYDIIARQTDRCLVPSEKILEVIKEIGRATGFDGMVGGQAVDLQSEGKKISARTLKYIHSRKTAALLVAGLRCGAVLAGACPAQIKIFSNFGGHLGLAFQIGDDILDIEGSTEQLGKTAGKDIKSQKATYPAVWGLKTSKKMLAAEAGKAEKTIKSLGTKGAVLKELLRLVVRRDK